MTTIVDSHCHLYDEKLKDLKQQILDSLEKDNLFCITNGDSPQTSQMCVEIAEQNENVFACVGTHPHEAKNFDESHLELYKTLAKSKKVVAIGEIGLDYHYMFSEKQVQIEVLKKQILLADELGLPCVFHVREATNDFLQIAKQMKNHLKHGAVVHSFNGSLETAKILLDMGFFLSFNGIATFQNARNVLEIIRFVPTNKMLVETDAPYLSPVPHRGEVNRPEFAKLVATKIAQEKGLSVEEVLLFTTQNAKNLFGLPI